MCGWVTPLYALVNVLLLHLHLQSNKIKTNKGNAINSLIRWWEETFPQHEASSSSKRRENSGNAMDKTAKKSKPENAKNSTATIRKRTVAMEPLQYEEQEEYTQKGTNEIDRARPPRACPQESEVKTQRRGRRKNLKRRRRNEKTDAEERGQRQYI